MIDFINALAEDAEPELPAGGRRRAAPHRWPAPGHHVSAGPQCGSPPGVEVTAADAMHVASLMVDGADRPADADHTPPGTSWRMSTRARSPMARSC